MLSNAISPHGDAAFSARATGYSAARDGLRTFDGLAAAIRTRQDSIGRAAVAASRTYPEPAFGHAQTAASSAAAAFGAYAATDAGRSKLEGLVSAAGGFLSRLFKATGPEQLRLPLEG